MNQEREGRRRCEPTGGKRQAEGGGGGGRGSQLPDHCDCNGDDAHQHARPQGEGGRLVAEGGGVEFEAA